jgi:uncharacterized protein YkwD
MFEHWKDFLHPHEGNDHHPHAYRKASAIALTCVVGIVLLISALQTGYVRQSSGFLSSVLPSVLVDITNENRLAEGLTEVEQNDTLTQAAQLKAEHMADNGYFAHDSPGGVTPWHWFEEADYGYEHAGENLAVNYSDSQDVVEAWMESRLHRENILEKDFTEIGIATARGEYEGKETVFVVQMFGTPNDRELAQRQNSGLQNDQENQSASPEEEQATEGDAQEQTTSTEQLVAQLSQQVAQVQEDVGNANVDRQQDESELQPDQQATPTNAELTQSNTQPSPNQPATTTDRQSTDTQTQQNEVTESSQNRQGRGQLLAQQSTEETGKDNVNQQDEGQLLAQQSNEQSRESTNQQPQLEFATPTEARMGSVAGESGVSLAPPPGTSWFDYLLSRPHLLFQLAMYTLVGLVLIALLVSIGFEMKHHHFWQAGVSFVAVLLIVVAYLFVQDLLFVETVVAGT